MELPFELDQETVGLIIRHLVSALVVVVLVYVIYIVLSRILTMLERRQRIPRAVAGVLRRFLRVVAALVCAVLVLQVFGVLENAWAALTAVLAMFAIGFVAVWSVLSNTLCSLIIMATRPFGIGDTIELPPDGLRGKVVNFSLIFTTLLSEDGDYIQVPNNTFFQRVIRRKTGEKSVSLDQQLMAEEDAEV